MTILPGDKGRVSRLPYLLLQLLFLVIAVFLLVYGIVRGEPAVVLKKAVRICLECIGLG